MDIVDSVLPVGVAIHLARGQLLLHRSVLQAMYSTQCLLPFMQFSWDLIIVFVYVGTILGKSSSVYPLTQEGWGHWSPRAKQRPIEKSGTVMDLMVFISVRANIISRSHGQAYGLVWFGSSWVESSVLSECTCSRGWLLLVASMNNAGRPWGVCMPDPIHPVQVLVSPWEQAHHHMILETVCDSTLLCIYRTDKSTRQLSLYSASTI